MFFSTQLITLFLTRYLVLTKNKSIFSSVLTLIGKIVFPREDPEREHLSCSLNDCTIVYQKMKLVIGRPAPTLPHQSQIPPFITFSFTCHPFGLNLIPQIKKSSAAAGSDRHQK